MYTEDENKRMEVTQRTYYKRQCVRLLTQPGQLASYGELSRECND